MNYQGLTKDAASELARAWFEASDTWAHAFLKAAEVDGHSVRGALRRETLSFACCLLELRLAETRADSSALCQAVREEIASFWREEADAIPFAWRRLSPVGADTGQALTFDRAYSVCREGDQSAPPGAARIFEDFCAETGLGSSVLVGGGANLASILYYLVVHGVLVSQAKMPSERKRRVLRVARECRAFFGASIGRALKGCGDGALLPPPGAAAVEIIRGPNP